MLEALRDTQSLLRGVVTRRDTRSLLREVGMPLERAAPAFRGTELDPAQRLLDLRLPDDLKDVIVAPLRTLDFWFEDRSTEATAFVSPRKYSALVNRRGYRSLIYIPWWILDNPTESNLAAVDRIAVVPFRGPIYVVSDYQLTKGPAAAYRTMMESSWKDKNLAATYLIGRDLEELQTMDDSNPKVTRLRWLLSLDEILEDDVRTSALMRMTVMEAEKMTDALANTQEFQDARGRRNVIVNASLDELFRDFNYEGAPAVVAEDMIRVLRKLGPKESDQALGLLLAYFVQKPDLRRETLALFSNIISDNKLLSARNS